MLAESLAAMQEIEPTMTAVEEWVAQELSASIQRSLVPPIKGNVFVKFYADDDRIDGWDKTHIVTLEGWGPVGFCAEPIAPRFTKTTHDHQNL